MTKIISKKSLSILLVLAMIISLFAGMSFGASATSDVWDGSVASAFASGSGTYSNPYVINTGAQLAYLAQQVNGGTSYSDQYFSLGNDINLNSVSWTPIGGQSPENTSTSIPNGKYFAGTFEGNGHTIEGLNITATVTTGTGGNFAGWGLFGCSSGPIKNLTVKGAISISGAADYVGGLVGYTTSDVYNCHTEVTITAVGSGNVGGVVGAIERTDTSAVASAFHVQACSAKNNISALKRIGGVVGGVYCKYAGNVIVDNCYYSSGSSTMASLTANETSSKVWSGGVVGYCKGYITNCYAIAALTASGGHYLCGIVGLLNGASPQAKLEKSYAAVSFSGASTSYDRPLYGSCDDSNTLQINNCLYDSTLAGSYTNTVATGSNGWGYWTSTGEATTTALKSSSGTATVYSSPSTTGSSASISTVLGTAFTVGTNSYNNNYPYLKWQASASDLPPYTPGSASSSGTASAVYLDGVNGSDSNGGTSSSDAFKTLDKAIQGVISGGTIYVVNTVTLSGDYNYSPTLTIKRFGTGTFPLFEITSGTVTLSALTLDGNYKGTLISLTGGTLNLRGNVKLREASTAISVTGGSLVINRANIRAYTYSVNLSGGSLTIDDYGGTSIIAPIYLASGKTITVASTLTNLKYSLDVKTAVSASTGLQIANGSGYTLTAADARMLHYVNDDAYSIISTGALSNSIFLSGSGNSNGTGTESNPYNSISAALSAAYSSGRDIYIKGSAIALSSTNSLNLSGGSYDGAAFYRAQGYTGNLFTSSGTNTISGVTIDGNLWGGASGIAMVKVTGGTLTIGTDAVLQANVATGSGGALYQTGGAVNMTAGRIAACSSDGNFFAPVFISSGTFTMSGGEIVDNDYMDGENGWCGGGVEINGGAFTMSGGTIANNRTEIGAGVDLTSGSFTMTGGIICDNVASDNCDGGGVYVGSGTTFNMSGGTISGNYATNGGGVYVGGTFTMTGGTISGNTATKGEGVYKVANTTFNLGCSGIASTDTVYLANTTATNCYITLTAALTNNITVECANPTPGTFTTGTRIASASSGNIVSSSLTKISVTGYTVAARTSGSPYCVYINGVAA